jgi:hypothetical protein
VAHDTVEFELVTSASSADHVPCPAARLDSAMASYKDVLLLDEFFTCIRREHEDTGLTGH